MSEWFILQYLNRISSSNSSAFNNKIWVIYTKSHFQKRHISPLLITSKALLTLYTETKCFILKTYTQNWNYILLKTIDLIHPLEISDIHVLFNQTVQHDDNAQLIIQSISGTGFWFYSINYGYNLHAKTKLRLSWFIAPSGKLSVKVMVPILWKKYCQSQDS